jgi:hypothetical protein
MRNHYAMTDADRAQAAASLDTPEMATVLAQLRAADEARNAEAAHPEVAAAKARWAERGGRVPSDAVEVPMPPTLDEAEPSGDTAIRLLREALPFLPRGSESDAVRAYLASITSEDT